MRRLMIVLVIVFLLVGARAIVIGERMPSTPAAASTCAYKSGMWKVVQGTARLVDSVPRVSAVTARNTEDGLEQRLAGVLTSFPQAQQAGNVTHLLISVFVDVSTAIELRDQQVKTGFQAYRTRSQLDMLATWNVLKSVRCGTGRARPSPTPRPKPTPTPTPTPIPTTSPFLIHVTGTGSYTTRHFSAPGQWYYNWSYDCSNINDEGDFNVTVHSTNRSLNLRDTGAQDHGDGGQGTQNVDHAGTFWITVTTTCNWDVAAFGGQA